MNYRNCLGVLRIVLGVVIVIFMFSGGTDAAVDCSKCHTAEVDKSAIKAKDTIEMNEDTCLKCHNPNYPPVSIGYNTHLAHIGKYTVKVDYLTRHPKVTESLNCNGCHIDIGENCKSCHIKNIPHIKPPLGDNCKLCHGELDKLFRHPTIGLKIHNLFNDSNDTRACMMCHNPDNMKSLKLANDKTVSIQENYRLCYQCHSGYYNLWNSGLHYSNKTSPVANINYRMVSSLKKGWEDAWRKENTCTNCHNPHNPIELYQLPSDQRMEEVTNISVIANINLYLYLIGALILITCTAFVMKKKGLKFASLSEIKNIDISKIKSKLKIPKISIPISISVESERTDKIGKANEIIDKVEIVEDTKTEKIKKIGPEIKKKYRKDILFILSIVAMLGLFYIVFGVFMPFVVVVSESMSPHIERGDIIFYTDISRVTDIRTHNDSSYESFGNYGDVIIYRPEDKKGRLSTIPYIHRAMHYVEKGNEMWPSGPNAVYTGYITKGDNDITNSKYDQQMDISRNKPVKREQIIGVAKFRIPYIGYIKFILS